MSEEEEFEFRLRLEQERSMQAMMEPPVETPLQQAGNVVKQAGKAVLASSPANLTKEFFQTDPATMQRVGGPVLPIVGGMAAGPAGASGGEFLRQMTGTALAPDTVPKTHVGRAASVITAGIVQEPKILEAIPGIPAVKQMASKMLSKSGEGLAKAAQALSGGKAFDYKEAARKGLATYAAPSKQEAGQMFQKALAKLPGESVAPTMAETMESALAPEASAGSKYLKDISSKIDGGELIDARQALKAKQAIDDVIDTVPIWQTKRRSKLFDLKRVFDETLSSQSGALKGASNAYRAAALKENMTKFLPVNKHGEYSRLAPMLASLVGGVGGIKSGSAEKGALGGAGYLLATSPLAFGALATGGGSLARGLNVLGQNPATRQALLGVLQQLMQNKNARQ